MNVRIIGAPVDLGQQRRGVDMGPSAIRAGRLHTMLEKLGHHVFDDGNVFSPEKETRQPHDETARYMDEVIEACEHLADRTEAAAREGDFVVTLGGDHSIAMGSLAGLTRARGRHGLVWVDAHADYNTPESSPSGNIHGMPVAALCGHGGRLADIGGVNPKVAQENVVMIGLREVDDREAERVNASPITAFTMRDVDELGMRRVMEEAIRVAGAGVDRIHLSFDIDAVDPQWAPGSGTLVDGGLSLREAHLVMELMHDSGKMESLDLVEVNPLLDQGNKTGILAARLIASALGKSVL